MQSWQKICTETLTPLQLQSFAELELKQKSKPEFDSTSNRSPAQSKAIVPQTQPPFSAVRRAVDYLQLCIRDQAALGDRTGALALAGVLEVLHGIGRASDLLIRRAEGDAYDYIANYTELAEEAGAGVHTLQGLWLVADVLAATDFARKEEMHTGQLCSYARVEEIYGMYYAPNRNF